MMYFLWPLSETACCQLLLNSACCVLVSSMGGAICAEYYNAGLSSKFPSRPPAVMAVSTDAGQQLLCNLEIRICFLYSAAVQCLVLLVQFIL